jgi:hypothetical protein
VTIAFTIRQYNLISSMKSKAPTVSDTRWESLAKYVSGSKKKELMCMIIFNRSNRIVRPVQSGQLMAVAAFSNKTFKLLQGHSVTVAAQQAHINSLQTSLMQRVNCVGPLSVGEASSLCSAEWYLEDLGKLR